MDKTIKLTLEINPQELEQFQIICEKENISVASAIADYVTTCIKAKRVFKSKNSQFNSEKNQANIQTDFNVQIETIKDIEPINKTSAAPPLVLLVEDSLTLREMLSLAIIQSGYQVEKASDGQQAWSKLNAGLSCDLILSDIEMPRMDGWDLLSQIKQNSRLAEIPVAMLTMISDEKYHQQAQEKAARLGANGYLSGPDLEKDLQGIVRQLLNGENVFPSSIKAIAPEKIEDKQPLKTSFVKQENYRQKPSRHKVMVVDDSIVVRQMVKMSFEKFGYLVEQARDGQQAWEMLNSGLSCDLIVCDIEMPRMNGLELLSLIQKHPQLTSIPVAMLTSRGSGKMKEIAAKRGAKAYFVKPFVENSFIDSVQKVINGEVLLNPHLAS